MNKTWFTYFTRLAAGGLVLVSTLAFGYSGAAPADGRAASALVATRAVPSMSLQLRHPTHLFNCNQHDGASCFKEGMHIPCDEGNGTTGECFCQADLHYICV